MDDSRTVRRISARRGSTVIRSP